METPISGYLVCVSTRFKPTYKGWKPISFSSSPNTSLQVLSLPTRDGNNYRGWSAEAEEYVLSLPTRDGNGPSSSLMIPSPSSFKPTYKGWKLASALICGQFPLLVLSLPTRDGNGWWEVKSFQEEPVLSLPTRDGNAWASSPCSSVCSCFKPTYKGWKPTKPLVYAHHYRSFKPTYKGWKRIYIIVLLVRKRSFKPTYKGWKRNWWRKKSLIRITF